MSTARQGLTDRARRYRRSFRQVLEADLTRGTDVDETALVSFEHDRFPDPAPRSHRRGVRVAFLYSSLDGFAEYYTLYGRNMQFISG
jgi:hypothetical protein